MWAAIRSDLQEFALGIADETDQVIASTASKTSTPISGKARDAAVLNDDGEVIEGGYAATGAISSAQDEIARREEDIETYTTPLDESDEDVQAFLDTFQIDDKTQEIAELLKEHPETIQVHFESLVPTEISYALFWQRYFYRCGDDERIERQWQEERDARRQARADAISGGIASVTNLFGGALSAVSHSLEKADHSIDDDGVPMSPFIPSGGSTKNETAASGGGMNLFGNAGRPPFVMNTAVDEDEDGEEEEEEELGWDDDDDDDEEEEEEEEEESDDAEMDTTEEITFSGGRNNEAVDKLSEQLVQAISERDACKETIELQNKEITNLKEGQPVSDSDLAVEKLKMTLFEKDAELAALKASLEDTHEDDGSSNKNSKKDAAQLELLTKDVTRLTEVVTETEAKLASQTEAVNEAQEELVRLRDAASSGQQVLQSSLDSSMAEAASLRSALEGSSSKTDELEESQEQINSGLSKLTLLEAELKEAHDEVLAAKNVAVEIEHGMEALQLKLVQVQGELVEAKEDADDAQQAVAAAKEAAAVAITEADQAKEEAAQLKEAVAAANEAAAVAITEADEAKEEVAQLKEAVATANEAAAVAITEADQAKEEAAQLEQAVTAAKEAAIVAVAEADQAKQEAAQLKEAAAEATTEATQLKEAAGVAATQAAQAKEEAEQLKQEAAVAKEAAVAAVVVPTTTSTVIPEVSTSAGVDPTEVVAASPDDRSSPSSESTGVKVDPPTAASSSSPPAPAAGSAGDEEEDEWGDDWSEDDE